MSRYQKGKTNLEAKPIWIYWSKRQQRGLRGAETPTFRSGGLISKIVTLLFVSQNILQGPFWSHKRNYSIKKLVVG